MSTPGGQVQVSLQGGAFTQGPSAAQVNAPGYQTPYGGISFTAQVPQGGTLTVTLTFPQALPQGAVLLKCTGQGCNPIPGAQLSGQTATFQIQDGGALDADGQANGRVVDPVALGVPTEPQGILDSSFGTGGKVLLDLPGNAYYDTYPPQMLVQPDGRILMAGERIGLPGVATNQRALAVARYNPDGSLDTSFAGGGFYSNWLSQATGFSDTFGGIALTPDGGMVLVGGMISPGPSACPYHRSVDVAAIKLSASGSTLWVSTRNLLREENGTPNNPCDDGTSEDRPLGVAVDSSGRILIVGRMQGLHNGAFILRLNPDGSLDTSFGNGGLVLVPQNMVYAYRSVRVQPDGKILAGGNVSSSVSDAGEDFVVARYNPDGSLDSGFGNNGYAQVHIASHESVTDLLVLPDGKILVATGVGSSRQGIRRLNPDGTRDTGYFCGMVHLSSGTRFHAALALQPNGKVLFAAWDLYAFYLYRLGTDGSPEQNWSFTFGGSRAYAFSVAYLDQENRILVGGIARAANDAYQDFAIVKLR